MLEKAAADAAKGLPDDWWLREVSTWHPRGAAQVNEAMKGWYSGALRADYPIPMTDIRRITARTMLISGDRDRYSLDVSVELYHTIPNSRLWIVPNAGHPVFFFCEFAPAEVCAGGKEAGELFPALAKQFLVQAHLTSACPASATKATWKQYYTHGKFVAARPHPASSPSL